MPIGLLECVPLSPRAGSSTDNRSKCSDGGGQHTTYFIVPKENFQEMLFFYGILSFSLTKQIRNKLDSLSTGQLSCFWLRMSRFADSVIVALRKSCGTGRAKR